MKALTLILFLSISFFINGQTDSSPRFTQTGENEFPVRQIKEIEINNRHGHIFHTTWDRDVILITTTIWTNAPIQAAASDVMNDIFINQNHSSGKLNYHTRFGSNFFSNHEFGINYQVYAPANIKLNIKQKFGNVELINFTGDANLNLEYGHLNGENASITNGILYVSNGNIQISNLTSGEITHINGTLNIDQLGEVQLSSDFSVCTIEYANDLNLISSTGKFNINHVKNLHTEANFSFITINKLSGKGFIEKKEGSLTINGFAQDFNELTVSSRKADFYLNIGENTPYTIHGQLVNGNFTHYSSDNMRVFVENNVTSFSGNFSQGNIAKIPTLILFGTDCDISINNQVSKIE